MLLGQRRARIALSDLLEIAGTEEDAILVWESLAAIGALGSRVATRRLLRLFRSTSSLPKRQGAIFALGRLNDPRARSLFLTVVSNPKEDARTRGLAAEALGLLRPKKRSISVLIAALNDHSIEVRHAALLALGALRCKKALPALRCLQSDHTAIGGEGVLSDHVLRVISGIESFGMGTFRRLSGKGRPRGPCVTILLRPSLANMPNRRSFLHSVSSLPIWSALGLSSQALASAPKRDYFKELGVRPSSTRPARIPRSPRL